jgi:acetyl-CoA acetyltransferase
VFVLDWLRTPRGKGSPKGSLHHLTPVDLVVHLQRALVARTGLDPAAVEDVVLGAASQVGEQGANLARTAVLRAGWDTGVPGVTVNRFCASGLDAVAQTAARIRAGDLDLAVAGGVESVSRVPMFSDGGPLWSDPGAVHGLRPRARVVAAATVATDPVIMLTAGQQAVEKVLARAGLRPADVDVYEFAEAFSALCLRFRRDLDAGPDRLNPNGGTIAMGHAFGATGAILLGGCVDELERRDGRYGVAAVSGAAGLGVAVLLQRAP